MEKHPLHLKVPDLQSSPEVERAVQRRQRKTLERTPNDPSKRIEVFAQRLKDVLEPGAFEGKVHREGYDRKDRNIELLRKKAYDTLLIKPESFPESYFELQKRIAREQGHGDIQITPDIREQMIATAIEDQRASLDAWIDYLVSDDAAVYPVWFKYFVWENITKLSQFDKERGEYKKRTETTVAPFPDIYRETLAQIADLYQAYPKTAEEIEKQLHDLRAGRKKLKKQLNESTSDDAKKEILQSIISIEEKIKEAENPKNEFEKKFPTLYAELTQKSLAASLENREAVNGEWVKYRYKHPEDAKKLFDSIQGKGTGWCTAGQETAKKSIEGGDFYVYYTHDKHGQPTQPRMAIRMRGESTIAEVRGILPNQGVEPGVQEFLDKKLEEFGSEADKYRKKSSDMKYLTALTRKQENGEPLTKDDLVFLYEIDVPIEGFGYEHIGRDPRIQELRDTRNPKEDAPIVLECAPAEIAWGEHELTKDSKAYIGPLFTGIFSNYPNLEHIYTSFPEGKVHEHEVVSEHLKTGQGFIDEIEEQKMKVWNKSILTEGKTEKGKKFDLLMEERREKLRELGGKETINLVRLTVNDLFGDNKNHTVQETFDKGKEFGLELCPPETGPLLRLATKDDQPLNTYWRIAMETITDSGGNPRVFDLDHDEDGVGLDGDWAGPGDEWNPDSGVVFRLRKSESLAV